MILRCSSSASPCNDDEDDDGFMELLDDNVEVRPRPFTDGNSDGVLLNLRFWRLACTHGLHHSCRPQNVSGMPAGMASLLTAPLVAGGAAEDSVSSSLVLKKSSC